MTNLTVVEPQESAPSEAPVEVPPKRPPGRPKGTPKTGGRQKAPPPPKTLREVRQWVLENTNLLENLGRMADGKRIQAVGPTGKKYWRDIGWEDQKWAMGRLLPKVAADLSAAGVELSGPDGGAIQQRTEILAASERVVAAMAEASTADDPAVAMDAEGLHGIKAISFLAARQAAQERDQAPARPSTPAVDLPAPEPSGEPVESVEEDPLLQGEPEAPDPGHALRFMGSDWYIKGFGPVREGLPNVYELRCPSGLVRRGPFAMCMDLLTTQMGGDVGEWTDQVPERLARANTS